MGNYVYVAVMNMMNERTILLSFICLVPAPLSPPPPRILHYEDETM